MFVFSLISLYHFPYSPRSLCSLLEFDHSIVVPVGVIVVINDENNRGYIVVQAVESLFRIIDRGITDRENAEHIKEIKESLNALEGGRVVDA